MENDHNRTVHRWRPTNLKGKRHILFVAVVSMIVALVILHVAFANSIYRAGRLSLKNPLSYLTIGGFLVLAAFKLKLLWRFKNSIGKQLKNVR